MGAINAVTDLTAQGDVAVLTVNSPPVNALSQQVRDGIVKGMQQAIADAAVKAVVLICDGRTFIAGADITEFGKPPQSPSLHDVCDTIENSTQRAESSPRLRRGTRRDVSTDPVTLLVPVLFLASVAMTATYLPARRAMRVDRMVAPRAE